MLNKNIPVGGPPTIVHSNPKDLAGNDQPDTPGQVTWAADTNAMGDIAPQDAPGPVGLKQHCKFTLNGSGHLGVTTITMACGSAPQKQVTVTVGPGPFDHFEPSFD